MRGPEEWPSSGSNPADRIRLTGPAANKCHFQGRSRSPPSAVLVWPRVSYSSTNQDTATLCVCLDVRAALIQLHMDLAGRWIRNCTTVTIVLNLTGVG